MIRWLIRTAISLVVVAVLLAFIPIGAVVDALRRTNPLVWMASLVVFFAGHYVNALKLRLLLGPSSLPISLSVRAQYAGLVANLGLPGLAGGDLVRAAYLVPTLGATRVAIASVADRVIDTATVMTLVLVALPFAGVPPALRGVIEQGGWWIGGIGAAGLAGGVGLLWLRPHRKIAKTLDEARAALHARRGAIAGAAAMSLLVQAAFVMTNVWLAREVGVTTGIAAWFVAWPLSKLIAILPISLGGLGVREAALVSLLAPYGAPRDAVLASGILWQAVLAISGLAGLLVTHGTGGSASRPSDGSESRAPDTSLHEKSSARLPGDLASRVSGRPIGQPGLRRSHACASGVVA
jgi:uncharacterized membrane protein YbhN (UPF0104 family)